METRTNELNREPSLIFDWADAESVSEAVITAVMDISGEDPMEMEPLYTGVDPDSIDGLFDSNGLTSPRNDLKVEFSFNGFVVQLRGTGEGYVFRENSQERPADSTFS